VLAPAPPVVDRLARAGVLVGGAAGAILALGAVLRPPLFFQSYLFGFLFWVCVSLGCLSLSFVQHLTGGMWGLSIRRILEAGTRTLSWAGLFFVPLVFGLPHVYEWARPEAAADALLQRKAPYLNPTFFVARAAFYFAVWWLLVHLLNRWSAETDGGPDLRVERRLRGLSGAGLLLVGFTVTFSSVDWAMSLDPHWFSTVYGILFMVCQVLAAMSLVIVVVALLGGEEPLVRVVDRTVVHDLGKLLFAFVMLWGYISFAQFLIIWSANLPEEIPWYIRRLHGGWQWLALVLVVFQFVLPFSLLLSRTLKRNARALALVATGILAVRFADLLWLLGPDLHGHEHGFGASALLGDVAAFLAFGGLWTWAFARGLKSRPLLPVGDPEVRERLAASPRPEPAHG
jgi:hypothetical protein